MLKTEGVQKKQIDVAIGLIFHHNDILVGWRDATQHQGNHDEFPGGKVEKHETPIQACRREVAEEAGLDLTDWHWVETLHYDYGDRDLRLHFFKTSIDAIACKKINSAWSWHARADLFKLNFPAANAAILQRLYWPSMIRICADFPSITPVREGQSVACLHYWRLELAQNSVGFQKTAAYQQLLAAGTEQRQQLIINIELYQQLPVELQAEMAAVHYKQHQLHAAYASHQAQAQHLSKTQPQTQNQPQADKNNDAETAMIKQDQPNPRRIAACHDLASVKMAAELGFDAVFLSPVQATASHPGAAHLGWQRFAEYAAFAHMPVFALGGVAPKDLAQVRDLGGYGVAGIRQFEPSK